MTNSDRTKLIPIGWREWVALPAWNVKHLKAKVDTGARTSSLHVSKITRYEKDGRPWIRFTVHPWQKSSRDALVVEAPVVSDKEVRSSSGFLEKRPVVKTEISVAGRLVTAEITLTNRSQMGFRMLLGREAMRRRFMVIPGESYLGGKPEKSVLEKNRSRT